MAKSSFHVGSTEWEWAGSHPMLYFWLIYCAKLNNILFILLLGYILLNNRRKQFPEDTMLINWKDLAWIRSNVVARTIVHTVTKISVLQKIFCVIHNHHYLSLLNVLFIMCVHYILFAFLASVRSSKVNAEVVHLWSSMQSSQFFHFVCKEDCNILCCN